MIIRKPVTSFILSASLALCLFSGKLLANDEPRAVAEKVTALTKAMINADKKMLEELSSPSLSYGHSSGVMENQREFIEKLVSGKSDFVTIDLSEQTISISGDVALVRHTLNADIKDGGVASTIKLGVLLVWQKQRGDWKLLARQAFKLPPANLQ
jgi:hypothetical protein